MTDEKKPKNEFAQADLHLAKIEREHDVRIIYACEAGSRAWGFASPDSDYDIRFIYVRPIDWYLSYNVETMRDVIETDIVDNIDVQGWDLRKALYLFTRTNGCLVEWLNSPIVYHESSTIIRHLRELLIASANPIALCYHYSHMARGNAREYLFGDQVRLKKYFYVIRPLLAVMYVERGLGIPPVRFSELVASVAPDSLRKPIARLLKLKAETKELGLGDPIPEINDFIQAELARHGKQFSGQSRPDILEAEQLRDKLNELFRDVIYRTSNMRAFQKGAV